MNRYWNESESLYKLSRDKLLDFLIDFHYNYPDLFITVDSAERCLFIHYESRGIREVKKLVITD